MNESRQIGGRWVDDVQQFWWSVRGRMAEYYPINKAPDDLVNKVNHLVDRANALAEDGKEFLKTLPDDFY